MVLHCFYAVFSMFLACFKVGRYLEPKINLFHPLKLGPQSKESANFFLTKFGLFVTWICTSSQKTDPSTQHVCPSPDPTTDRDRPTNRHRHARARATPPGSHQHSFTRHAHIIIIFVVGAWCSERGGEMHMPKRGELKSQICGVQRCTDGGPSL